MCCAQLVSISSYQLCRLVLWEAGSEMGTPVQDVNWECPGIHTCEREGAKKSAGQMEGRLKL